MMGGQDQEKKFKIIKDFGVAYYRNQPAIFTENWNGFHPDVEYASKAGLKLVLTVRNGAGPQQAGHPPADIEQYKKTLAGIIKKYQPEILVVENEENSARLFYDGTPSEYERELRAATEVAHAMGVKVTNGGLVSKLVAALAGDHLTASGRTDEAEIFLKKTLGNGYFQFQKKGKMVVAQLEKGKELLEVYKSVDIDFVNFHWYTPDADAFKIAVSFLREATGKPVITNEIGQQKSVDPKEVEDLMTAVLAEKIPVAIWFSMDVHAFAEARGLVAEDGSLRSNGIAFKNFIQKNCK